MVSPPRVQVPAFAFSHTKEWGMVNPGEEEDLRCMACGALFDTRGELDQHILGCTNFARADPEVSKGNAPSTETQ